MYNDHSELPIPVPDWLVEQKEREKKPDYNYALDHKRRGRRTKSQIREASRRKDEIQALIPEEARISCRCNTTGCLKKYCDCFKLGVKCTVLCECRNCMNTDDKGSFLESSMQGNPPAIQPEITQLPKRFRSAFSINTAASHVPSILDEHDIQNVVVEHKATASNNTQLREKVENSAFSIVL